MAPVVPGIDILISIYQSLEIRESACSDGSQPRTELYGSLHARTHCLQVFVLRA